MNSHIKQLFFLTVIAILLVNCNNHNETPIATNNQELFDRMVLALGGETAISNAAYISFSANGIASEFQEDPEPINGDVSEFSYDLLYNLEGNQSKQAWSISANYAFYTDFSFTETIDHINGKSEGATGTFSTFFSGFGVQGDPMFSTKIGARQKTLLMSSPLAISKMISEQNEVSGSTLGTIKVGYNTSEIGFGSDTPDIELVVDTSSNLPTKAKVIENDPLLGDVIYEVIYDNWTTINDVQVPQKLTHILDGNIIRTETRTTIEINPNFDSSELTVTAAEAWSYDSNEAKYGHLSSQFHYRTLLQTFPIDFPVEIVDQTSPLALASELVVGDTNAFRVSGDFQSHYTYAFKVDGGILLYDSPVNDRRSAAVLNKIRSEFSTAPITYIVNSHNHFDHSGGVRGNLKEGGELIVGNGSKSFIENVLERPSTVLPNPIAGKTINVIGLSDSMRIGSGEEEIQLYTIPTIHAEEEDYIVLYKPSTKTLYFNDLYNPGFVFVFDSFIQKDKDRMIEQAHDIVNFVNEKGLDVEKFHCTHGFTTQDFDYQTIINLAN